MKLHTTSEVISFAKNLESESAKFYECLSQKYVEGKDVFLPFAEENKKNIVQTERAYYGVITDAIEGCFAFNVETDEYAIETLSVENMEYSDALNTALDMEEKITRFYIDAAAQSRALMADVPRTFQMVAKKRSARTAKLKLLINKEGST